ncbi:MAG: glycolate oxidase binding subunit [Actinomycetota bacterium]|nr:glycolate oxidase binding subunit [Actinomycetota bacterium]
MEGLHPDTKTDVAEMLSHLSSAGTATLIVGGRRDMGRAVNRGVGAELWTTQLDRVIAYDPAEMLAVVEAGMRIRDLQALLAGGDQEWPVDAHPDATVGGVIAAGISGIRRLRTGLMRDSVVELELVTGDGRLIRSGARTVKNVTGFDVHRLATGSFGSLGAIVQVAIKVRPRPKVRRTLVLHDGGVSSAERLLDAVPLPAAVIAEPDRIELVLEGWPEEVEEQTAAARAVTAAFDVHEDRPTSRVDELWPDAGVLAEVAVTPSRIETATSGASRWRALMGVGLVWIPLADQDALGSLRTLVAAESGTVTAVRGGVHPAAAVATEGTDIAARLVDAFDPAGILS